MSIQEILADQGMTTALIVDDGYDAVPRAQDMVLDEDGWSNFFADLGNDRQHLIDAFPAFAEMTAQELQQSDGFVAAAWHARATIRPELWNVLFSSYEQATNSDRKFLENLEAELKSLGVTPIPSGREVPEAAREANVIFADLYLGTAQEPENIELSVTKLKDLLRGREDNPPVVILMSRSELLEDKKAHFRDKAKLLGAMFRVYRKTELLEGGTLERTLERLARHRPDAVRVARFVYSWEKGLAEAANRFLDGIRRLDLSDYAQIREVLLNFEGQPLGSYLLDVFDRVLQHEIEGDQPTISAAEALNGINTGLYPAPHISGSADLQDLVYRTIWQNPKRLGVKATVADIPVGFGDVLVRRSPEGGVEAEKESSDTPDALVVLTPACDLVRDGGVKRILFVAGKFAPLTSKTWIYSDTIIKTPIVVLEEGGTDRRMWIHWNAKNIRTLLPAEVTTLLGEQGGYRIARRLRESYSLELQQRILTSMGRVGLIVPMPATFPVEIAAYTFDTAGEPQQLKLRKLASEGGVCYTGRDKDGKENCRLVLTEPVIDELLEAIANISEDTVNSKARAILGRLKASTSLATDLQLGLKVPASNKSSFVSIKAMVAIPEGNPTEVVVGMIARNPNDWNFEAKSKAFAMVLSDLPAKHAELQEEVVQQPEGNDVEQS